MKTWISFASVFAVSIALAAQTPAQVVSTKTLLHEMTDLASMAEFPDPPYTCKQFSSYDRRSKSPQENWFANGDCGQYLRTEQRGERTEYVMMDADGPGAIVRIWSANPKGTLRIYLDHNQAPTIEAPMADLLSGKVPGIPEPIAHTASAGWNCYFPFPYAKHCKVTSDEGGFYYHVNYRTYPPDTSVATFRRSDLRTLAANIARVAKELATPHAQAWKDGPPPLSGEGKLLEPGASDVGTVRTSNPGALVGLAARVEAGGLDGALRQLLLRLEFDGERTVECPLGDFFGAAPGVNPYSSLPSGVNEDGVMWCNWVMPFRRSVRSEIVNLGDQPVRVWFEKFQTGTYEWTEGSMHFHAQWRTELDVPTRPMQDWNYVQISGQGVFAGAAFAIANPVKHWWGEGDEKIYVDGETFPSHFGTGTEDYYGYAWCNPALFTHAYHNQPRCDGPRNYGHTAVNRWHIIDRIPFQRDFRFDMELWHSHSHAKVTMSVVTYWYARPGATSNRMGLTADHLRVPVVPAYVPQRVAGAIEGETMRIVEKAGTPVPQGVDQCSNEQHLWWRDAQPGDKLVVAFEVPQAGRYRVLVRCLKARDYGVHQLFINGRKAGEPIDLYNDGITPTDEILLGEFDLTAGENRLGVEIVGTNEKAVKSYMFGLDYVRLEAVP